MRGKLAGFTLECGFRLVVVQLEDPKLALEPARALAPLLRA